TKGFGLVGESVTGGVASSRQLGLGLGQSGGFLDIISYPPWGCWASPVLNHPGVSDPSDGYMSEERTGERQGMAESEDKSQLRVTVAGLTLIVRKRPEFDEEEENARKKMARRRKGTDGAGGEQS
ncbi:hypothetical protein EV361DRAFT_865169, partial [Lentinula raphanica]